uniref:Endoglucanase C (EgC) (Endo-1,4-beta-glucanase C) (Cellulase C) n=1 Tax=uncultured bacterium contig00033 TaxID=1181522 RepID=A0A806K0B9_9BACT|nr:endoglucanase C (EgC) (endo-1,4-beta-glucanase C) (cellulase C) [uncultured bacterium contig00033]
MQEEIMKGYKAGVNLGGWISQCDLTPERIARFIAKEDIARIASWKLDHVRLPFDYPVLEEVSGVDGFAVIDTLIGWCKDCGLNVVLDMHHAPGYVFDRDDKRLFTDAAVQDHFFSIWEKFAGRYKSEGTNLLFELMNEITDPHGDTWNRIARTAIEKIHAIDPKRFILLGGPYYNSAAGLDLLEVWDDERILYNFHFYEPFLFTHQRAGWSWLKNTDIRQPYPGKIEGVDQIKKVLPKNDDFANHSNEKGEIDRDFVLKKMAPAINFARRTGKTLYCGEYGAIDLADMDSRVNWLRDVTALFNEHNIGRAYWSYKGMNFSSIDSQGNPVSAALVSAIASV